MFAASNELPESQELAALYDRLILRYPVGDIIDDSNFEKMMTTVRIQGCPGMIPMKDLEKAWVAVDAVDASQVPSLCRDLRGKLKTEGLTFSPRRWRESKKVLQAEAFLNGKDQVTAEEFSILQHVLWEKPADIKVSSRIILQMVSPDIQLALDILDKASEVHKNAMDSKKSDVGIESNEKLKKLIADAGKLRKDRKIEDIQAQLLKMQRDIIKDCIGFSF